MDPHNQVAEWVVEAAAPASVMAAVDLKLGHMTEASTDQH
jgi:hypothetical protein